MTNLKSNLEIKLLGYFFINPNSRHYVRDIAERLDLDPGNLSKKLSLLHQEGLFLLETEGKNHYYSLNKKFPLLEEYKKIYESKFGLKESLAKELKKIPGLQEAYIYGSYAKNNFEDGSDIDLLLVGSHKFEEASRCVSRFEKRLHREINITDYSSKEFEKKIANKDPFLQNIMNDKIIKLL